MVIKYSSVFTGYFGFFVLATFFVLIISFFQIFLDSDFHFITISIITHILYISSIVLLGGIYSINGLIILMLYLKTFAFSQFLKIIFWQKVDLYLPSANNVIFCYLLSGAALFFASSIISLFGKQKNKLFQPKSISELRHFSYLSFILYFTGYFISRMDIGSFLASSQGMFRLLVNLALMSSIAANIKESNGTRSISISSVVFGLSSLFLGFLEASKQILLDPFLSYLIVCFFFHFKFKYKHVLTGLVIFIFSTFVLIPFSQFGRHAVRAKSTIENIENLSFFAKNYIFKLEGIKKLNKISDALTKSEKSNRLSYYGESYEFLGRLSMIRSGAELIQKVDQKGFLGWSMFFKSIKNPYIQYTPYGDKININNVLGRYSEIIANNNYQTSISFGLVPTAYAFSGNFGVFSICLFTFLIIFITNSILGQYLINNLFGISIFMYYQHFISENSAPAIIFSILRNYVPTIFCICFTFYISKKILPHFKFKIINFIKQLLSETFSNHLKIKYAYRLKN